MDVEIPDDPPAGSQTPDGELDDQGNPVGTEYDSDGNAIEYDNQGFPVGTEYDAQGNAIGYDENGDPIDPEPEPVAVAPTPRAPSSIQIPTLLSPEERDYGEAIFTPQQLAFMESLNARSFAAGQASMAVASSGVEQVLSGATAEYRQMVSPRIQTVISRMTPQQRADPHAADDALLVVWSEEARETGESVKQVAARHMQMFDGGTPPRAARPTIPVKPAGARAPSPSNAARGPVVRSASGVAKNIKMVADTCGITVREAENMGL